MMKNDVLADVVAEFGRKYLWWEPVGGASFSEDRIIAQTVNLGTYDDILLLEEAGDFRQAIEAYLAVGDPEANSGRSNGWIIEAKFNRF